MWGGADGWWGTSGPFIPCIPFLSIRTPPNLRISVPPPTPNALGLIVDDLLRQLGTLLLRRWGRGSPGRDPDLRGLRHRPVRQKSFAALVNSTTWRATHLASRGADSYPVLGEGTALQAGPALDAGRGNGQGSHVESCSVSGAARLETDEGCEITDRKIRNKSWFTVCELRAALFVGLGGSRAQHGVPHVPGPNKDRGGRAPVSSPRDDPCPLRYILARSPRYQFPTVFLAIGIYMCWLCSLCSTTIDPVADRIVSCTEMVELARPLSSVSGKGYAWEKSNHRLNNGSQSRVWDPGRVEWRAVPLKEQLFLNQLVCVLAGVRRRERSRGQLS